MNATPCNVGELDRQTSQPSHTTMTQTLEFARQVLASQPFSELLHAEIVAFGPDLVELRIPVTNQLKQQHGFVHGGVVSYAADNALTFAGGHALGSAVVTSEFKINYLRPAVGQVIIARAGVVHAGKTQAVCRCELYFINEASDEVLCAVAQGTVASLGQARSSGERRA